MRRLAAGALCALAVAAAAATAPAWAGVEPAADTAVATPAPLPAADAAALAEAAADLAGDIVFSVPSGTFTGELSVGLSTAVAGAEIRYTTDGTPPSAGSAVYRAPVRLTRTTQLRAQAFVGGAPSGAPGTGIYLARTAATGHDLPVLAIDAYGAGAPGREYVDAAVMEFQPAGGTTSLAATPTIATRGGFHLRGQSSASFPKVPYRLELWDNADDDADYPMLGMPADSDWVLRGPYTDKALIRDAFVYSLGRDMGMPAPRFAFAELYVNLDAGPVGADDYQGVYMLVETIKNSKNRLDLKQLDEDDTELSKITGGYIFKFEWFAAEEPILQCPGAAATCWRDLEVADPDPLNAPQRAWLTEHLYAFHQALRGPNFADPQVGYRAYIDSGSFVDQIIVNELSREMDAYIRSQYFYKDRDSKIFAGPLWDYDLTFGVGGFFNNDQIAGWQYQQTRQPVANDWFVRLMQDPAFVAELRARWQQLRGGLLSDAALSRRVDDLAAPLAAAAQRNFAKWPNLSQQQIGFFLTPTASTWRGQVDFMRDWMLRRAAWLDGAGGWGTGVPPTGGPTGQPTGGPTGQPTAPPATTPPPAGPGCAATYTATSQWTGGFQGEVRVTAAGAAINGWRVAMTFPDGQRVTQAWGATVTTAGATATAVNMQYNGALRAGESVTFGFLGSWAGTNRAPTLTCTAT